MCLVQLLASYGRVEGRLLDTEVVVMDFAEDCFDIAVCWTRRSYQGFLLTMTMRFAGNHHSSAGRWRCFGLALVPC